MKPTNGARRWNPLGPALLAGLLALSVLLPGGRHAAPGAGASWLCGPTGGPALAGVNLRGGYTPPNLPLKPRLQKGTIFYAPPAAAPARTQAMQWAVIIGISDYDGYSFDLQYCDDDARDVYDALTTIYGFPLGNIKMLLDSQATAPNIISAIDWLLASEQRYDTVVFYYSGHGSIESGDPDKDGEATDVSIVPWELSRIYDGDLAKKFSQLDASLFGKVWVCFDCCHAGGMLDAGITGSNKTVTMACRQDEYAGESSTVANGFFTHLMVDHGMLQREAAGYIPLVQAVKGGQFAGSSQSNKYHYPSCRYVKNIKPENLIWFSSAADAKARGYTPCLVCKPPRG